MISSEIARAAGRSPVDPSTGSRRVRSSKSNPQLLSQTDSLVLTTGNPECKNLGQGAALVSTLPKSDAMLPMGAERADRLDNSSVGGELSTRSAVTKYANPPAIEVNGQLWHLS
jgi:hypothetical protein